VQEGGGDAGNAECELGGKEKVKKRLGSQKTGRKGQPLVRKESILLAERKGKGSKSKPIKTQGV